ncbi:MAG: hypothetical protein ACJA1O_003567 [Spirosomataceae bacterium]|jgi:hypothetical protein
MLILNNVSVKSGIIKLNDNTEITADTRLLKNVVIA